MARRSVPRDNQWTSSFSTLKITVRTGTHTHDICLRTDGDQTVDVFANGHKNLSSHMATLLGTRGLVLNVDTGSTALNKKLGQLHDSGQTTVSGVSVSNDGTQVVNVCHISALLLGCRDPLLALFPVMEQLGHPELVYLVWHSVLGQLAKGLFISTCSNRAELTMG